MLYTIYPQSLAETIVSRETIVMHVYVIVVRIDAAGMGMLSRHSLNMYSPRRK